jgi:RpiB/LacA/LacB family sugar-phosphate isomerase
MIDQLGVHLGKRIVLGYDRHLLPEVDGYVAHLAAYGMVVTDTDPERLHYLSSAERVCRRVRGRADTVGVLACLTGIGVSIAANKFGGVYAARCLSVADAEMARTINNANVLCLAVGAGAALNAAIVDAFMRTPYQGRKLDELAGLLRFERLTKDGPRPRRTEPDLRFECVEQIDVATLATRGISGVLADLDGTLVGDHQHDVARSVTAWVNGLRARPASTSASSRTAVRPGSRRWRRCSMSPSSPTRRSRCGGASTPACACWRAPRTTSRSSAISCSPTCGAVGARTCSRSWSRRARPTRRC